MSKKKSVKFINLRFIFIRLPPQSLKSKSRDGKRRTKPAPNALAAQIDKVFI